MLNRRVFLLWSLLQPPDIVFPKKRSDDLIVLSSHTPEDYRGQGIATSIMKQVVLYARKNKLNIVPACTFAVHYCKKYKC